MKIDKSFTEDHQVKVTAEVEQELFEQFKQRAAKNISRTTKIPGFRPGKAPYHMVLSHVGEGAVVQQALELLLDDTYPKVLEAENIKPWGPGNLDSIKSEKPPVFEFTIPLEPETVLKDVESLNRTYKPTEVSEEEVANFITQTRRETAAIVPLTSPAAEGNVVYFNLAADDLNPADGIDPKVIKSRPHQVLIPSKTEERDAEWPYKGFARGLIGYKEGEKLDFTHEFPTSHIDEDFAGKKLHFNLDIQSVKGLELPELTPEYLNNLGNFETVDELKAFVRTRLEDDAKKSYDEEYYLSLIDELRERASIKYPPQMLAQEEEQVLHRIEHDLSHSKMDLDLYLKIRKTSREEFIEKEVKPAALNRLERSLVMDALRKEYDIKVENEALENEISQLVNQLFASGEFNAMQKELGQKKFSETVTMEAANRALEGAIRSKLLSIADPSAVPASDTAEDELENNDEAKPKRKKTTKKVNIAEESAINEDAEPIRKPAPTKAKKSD